MSIKKTLYLQLVFIFFMLGLTQASFANSCEELSYIKITHDDTRLIGWYYEAFNVVNAAQISSLCFTMENVGSYLKIELRPGYVEDENCNLSFMDLVMRGYVVQRFQQRNSSCGNVRSAELHMPFVH